jgi:uncharacterized membrane protein
MMGVEKMNKWILILSIMPAEAITFILGIFMPVLVRREIFFGVRIPEEYREREDFKLLHKRYRRNFILSSLLYLILFNALIYLLPFVELILGGIFVYILISFTNYYVIHKRVKEIKQEENWNEGKREVTVIDTRFRSDDKKKLLISPLWFLIPLGLVIFNLVLPIAIYDSLPDKLPLRVSNGIITGWQNKSRGSIMIFPLISLVITGMLFFVYKTMGWAKQLVSINNTEESKERNRLYRYRWSGFITFLCILMTGMFTVINLKILTVLPFVTPYDWLLYGGFGPVIILGTLVMIFWTGQGGSRIKLGGNGNRADGVIDRNDDKYWKMGSFYYNPDDPALWVEKRFGIGMTVNFGRPAAYFVLIGIFAVIALVPLITNLLQ